MSDYEAAANEMDLLKDTPGAFDGLVPVKARVGANPGVILSIRFNPGEFIKMSTQANAEGLTIIEYVRGCALNPTGAKQRDDTHALVVQEVREKARELAEAVQRL